MTSNTNNSTDNPHGCALFCDKAPISVAWWQYGLVLLVVFVGMPLVFYRYMLLGIDTADAPYHLLQSMEPLNAPLTLLTRWIGYCVGTLAGWDFIVFRWAAMFVMCATVSVGSLTLLSFTGNLRQTLWITVFTMALIGLDEYAFQFGYDMLTFLSMSLVLCGFVNYLRRMSVCRLALLGLLLAIAALIRLPNVLAAPCIALVIAFYHGNSLSAKTRVAHAVGLIAALTVFMVLLILPLYGSPISYAESLFQISPDGHGSDTLIMLYWMTGKKIVIGMVVCLAVYWLFGILGKIKNSALRMTSYVVMCGALFVLLILLQFIFRYQPPIAYISILYLWAVVFAVRSRSRDMMLFVFAVISVAVAACAGSNAAFVKVLTTVSLPYLWIAYRGVSTRQATSFLVVAGIAAISYNLFYNYWNYPMGHVKMKDIDGATTKIPALRHLKTSAAEAEKLDDIYFSTLDAIQPGDRFVVSKNNCRGIIWDYLFYELITTKKPVEFNFYDVFDDSTYVSGIVEQINASQEPVTILAVNHDKMDGTLLDEQLRQHTERVKAGADYAIYRKSIQTQAVTDSVAVKP